MEFTTLDIARCELVAIGAAFDARGWVPATSGNFSARLANGAIAITASGRQKGRLAEADIMTVNLAGTALHGGRPSAETALHLQLYRLFPEVGAVLHTHSPGAVALSRAFPRLDAWTIEGHELLKALPGQTTHEARVSLPIVANDQNIAALAEAIEPRLTAAPRPPAYLIRGHGLYAWGRDTAEAERVVEALEWLFAVDLTERQYRTGARA